MDLDAFYNTNSVFLLPMNAHCSMHTYQVCKQYAYVHGIHMYVYSITSDGVLTTCSSTAVCIVAPLLGDLGSLPAL